MNFLSISISFNQSFFQSVFVMELDTPIPEFPDKLEESDPLNTVDFTYNAILLELQGLNEDS